MHLMMDPAKDPIPEASRSMIMATDVVKPAR
jgi:hypothetical protein